MKKQFYYIIPVFIFLLNTNQTNAQCENFSALELKAFGPWLCPDYARRLINLEGVVLTPRKTNSVSDGVFFPDNFPTTPPGGGNSVSNDGNGIDTPCKGDPIRNPSIAPSSAGNYKGGTYGYTRNGGTKFHDGMDIVAEPNSKLYSMYDGVVISIRTSFSAGQYAADSYGNFVMIKSIVNNKVVYLKYNHLNSVNSEIKVGTQVEQGAVIGTTGTTGNAAANGVVPHTHIQARNEDGESIDPDPYIATTFDKTTGEGTSPCY
ncbi:M23 family metallopeptidase [Sinomicrobium pectinilyticum]|nr:M23 family metallopeptidase [Sinomicrobium pectinilyticum]